MLFKTAGWSWQFLDFIDLFKKKSSVGKNIHVHVKENTQILKLLEF